MLYVHAFRACRRGWCVMEASEVLIFRDYSGWEEPALSTPFGFWSLRNLIVLGIFAMVSGGLYSTIIPDALDFGRDWMLVCAALTPLAIGVIFGIARTPLGSADAVLIALLLLAYRSFSEQKSGGPGGTSSVGAGGGSRRKRKKSQVLGFPRNLPPPRGVVSADDTPLEITCTDLDELKSIRVTIYSGDGTTYDNGLVSCYLDDELLDVVRTSAGGELVLNIRPEREGGRRLLIREHVGDDSPKGIGPVLLTRPLQFIRRGAGAPGGAGAGGGA